MGMKKIKLDKSEKLIENEASFYRPVSKEKLNKILSILQDRKKKEVQSKEI